MEQDVHRKSHQRDPAARRPAQESLFSADACRQTAGPGRCLRLRHENDNGNTTTTLHLHFTFKPCSHTVRLGQDVNLCLGLRLRLQIHIRK